MLDRCWIMFIVHYFIGLQYFFFFWSTACNTFKYYEFTDKKKSTTNFVFYQINTRNLYMTSFLTSTRRYIA